MNNLKAVNQLKSNEREVLRITDNKGNPQFHEITSLQKKVLKFLPLITNKIDLYLERTRINQIISDKDALKESSFSISFLTELAKLLNVNRSTLASAVSGNNRNRLSLMEMGIVKRSFIAGKDSFLQKPAYFYYKICKEDIIIQTITEDKKITNREHITPGYINWKKNVLNRDKVCQCCGLDKHLEAHHQFGYAEYPELATDVNNGIVLCKFCHDKYHSIYGLKNINPRDLVEFVKNFGVAKK